MNHKIIDLTCGDDYRIIAISDVHGHKEQLEHLIKKLNLGDEDFLIILGDFLNRGVDSLEMYTYIRKLSERKNTYILKGNHEWFMEKAMTNFAKSDELLAFLRAEYYETLIATLAKNSEINIHTVEDSVALLKFLLDEYKEIVDYLRNLPIMLKIDGLTFVHGGIDPSFDIDKDEVRYLKYDEYNTKGKPNADNVIVGHWPSSNIRTEELSNCPYFNDEKNIIFIDGGLGVKKTGELNAFIVEKKEGIQSYRVIQDNNFVKKQIIRSHHFESEPILYANYPYYDLEILSQGEEMARCRHLNSGKIFSVFNDLFDKQGKKAILKMDYINRFLNVEVGEMVEVCMSFEHCHLVKYLNEFGWIKRNQIEN